MFQDCIATSDIKDAVGDVFGGKYESFFNDDSSEKNDVGQSEDSRSNNLPNEEDGKKTKSITGIAWNKER